MGTTESILVEDGNENLDRELQYSLQKHSTPQLNTAIPPHPAATDPRGRRKPPHANPQRRAIIRQSDSSIKANAAPCSTIFLLKGMVLGLSKSGKRTLLQRLEGKEPEFNGPRRSKRSEEADGAVKSEERTTASAPYQPPPDLPTFQEQIHLHVQASKKVSKRTAFDFYIVLLDPRHDRTRLQAYLTKTMQTAMRAQRDGSEAESNRPFSLCLLRNFRDLTPHDEGDENIVSESELTAWTLEVVQDYPDMELLLLQCTNTSLLNCFGLGQLHHFIYQSYVQRKLHDVQHDLRRAQEAAAQARHEAPASVSYEQYMMEMERLHLTTSGSRRSIGRLDDETSTTATSSGAGRRNTVLQQHQQEDASRRRRASSGESLSTQPSVQQSLEDAKDALEAFLESDGDDGNRGSGPRESVSDDDSDDDDDFFYDDTGDRNDTGLAATNDAQMLSEPSVDSIVSPKIQFLERKEESNPNGYVNEVDEFDGEPDSVGRSFANGARRNCLTYVEEPDKAQQTIGQDKVSALGVTNSSSAAITSDGNAAAGVDSPNDDATSVELDHASPKTFEKRLEPTPTTHIAGVDDTSSVDAMSAGLEHSSSEKRLQPISTMNAAELQFDHDNSDEEPGTLVHHKIVEDDDDSDSDFFIDEGSTHFDASTVAGADDCTDTKPNVVMDDVGHCLASATVQEQIADPDKASDTSRDMAEGSDHPTKISRGEIEDCADGGASGPAPKLVDKLAITDAPPSEVVQEPRATALPACLSKQTKVETTIERPPNGVSDAGTDSIKPSGTGQLSEAARAAIAEAQQNFERMLHEPDQSSTKAKKKMNDDGEKKKTNKRSKERKSKRDK